MELLKKNLLVCHKVVFFSTKDEEAFFDWIKKIECIENFYLENSTIYLKLNKRRLNNVDLSNFIGLFYRYKIEMHQLSRFLTDKNKEWFYDNKKAFWHKKVFKK